MKKIFIFLLSTIGMICLFNTSLSSLAQEELPTEYDGIVEYISNHLTEFKNEYNKDHKDEPLKATSVENHCLAYITDAEKYGVYLDFNGNNGYLVTTLDYELYAINTTDDLDYLKDKELVYYSSFDGFLYHDGTSYQKYEQSLARSAETVYTYNGKSGDGESDIYDIDEYVADRYPSYNLVETHTDIVFKYQHISTSQYRTSYYLKYLSSDGGYHFNEYKTENNCALTAAFNVMSAWQKAGIYPSLPSMNDQLDIRELIKQDPDYKYYGVGEDTVGHSFYWAVNGDSVLSKMYRLFYQMRLYAVEKEGYEPELGFNTTKTKNTMTYTMNHYGYYPTINTSTTFTNVIDSLNNNKAVFMGIAGSTSYSNAHAVTLVGYRKYTYKTGAWIFSQTKTAYFFYIDDGKGMTVYFDPNCNSKISYEFIYI